MGLVDCQLLASAKRPASAKVRNCGAPTRSVCRWHGRRAYRTAVGTQGDEWNIEADDFERYCTPDAVVNGG